MNASGYSQVSENDWTLPPSVMLYQLAECELPVSVSIVRPKKEPPFADVVRLLEEQMAHFEAEHERFVTQVQLNYVFQNEEEIRRFFKGHRTAPQVLINAVPHLRQVFGPDALLSVRARTDEYGSETLYGVVIWPGNVAEVRRGFDRFDDGWWIANSRQALGDVVFTYELI